MVTKGCRDISSGMNSWQLCLSVITQCEGFGAGLLNQEKVKPNIRQALLNFLITPGKLSIKVYAFFPF